MEELGDRPLRVSEASIEELGGTPRVPVALAIDASGSLTGDPIRELNEGLGGFVEDIKNDPVAADALDLAVLVCSTDVRIIQDFAPVAFVEVPRFQATGTTPLCAATNQALDMIHARVREDYARAEVGNHKPWLLVLSDGYPSESDIEVVQTGIRVRKVEKASRREDRVAVFMIGVGANANMSTLGKMALRRPRRLRELAFREFFRWLSESLRTVSRSLPDDGQVRLPDADDYGWEHV